MGAMSPGASRECQIRSGVHAGRGGAQTQGAALLFSWPRACTNPQSWIPRRLGFAVSSLCVWRPTAVFPAPLGDSGGILGTPGPAEPRATAAPSLSCSATAPSCPPEPWEGTSREQQPAAAPRGQQPVMWGGRRRRRGGGRAPHGDLRPVASATTFASEDAASSRARGQTQRRVLECPQVHTPPPPPPQACSATRPVGISFIISPLNLINPHPVMDLEISINTSLRISTELAVGGPRSGPASCSPSLLGEGWGDPRDRRRAGVAPRARPAARQGQCSCGRARGGQGGEGWASGQSGQGGWRALGQVCTPRPPALPVRHHGHGCRGVGGPGCPGWPPPRCGRGPRSQPLRARSPASPALSPVETPGARGFPSPGAAQTANLRRALEPCCSPSTCGLPLHTVSFLPTLSPPSVSEGLTSSFTEDLEASRSSSCPLSQMHSPASQLPSRPGSRALPLTTAPPSVLGAVPS